MKKSSRVLRVAIYIRVSTLDQAREGYSLDAQERTLRKWCADHKHEIYDLYVDPGVSGKDIDHRHEMVRLMVDARNKKFDTVLFWALSRFTRSVSDLYTTMAKFQAWEISLVSYTESFDTSTPMGRAMIGIVGVFAQLERELTSERVSACLAERARQGKRTCNEVLGYSLDGRDNLKIIPKEADYVRYVFDTYLKYKNLLQVAELCRQKGYHGKRGKTPTAQTIIVILTRPIYCGYNTFKGDIYKGIHPPIISVDTYNKVQSLLRRQGKFTGRPRKIELVNLPGQ